MIKPTTQNIMVEIARETNQQKIDLDFASRNPSEFIESQRIKSRLLSQERLGQQQVTLELNKNK